MIWKSLLRNKINQWFEIPSHVKLIWLRIYCLSLQEFGSIYFFSVNQKSCSRKTGPKTSRIQWKMDAVKIFTMNSCFAPGIRIRFWTRNPRMKILRWNSMIFPHNLCGWLLAAYQVYFFIFGNAWTSRHLVLT